MKTLKWIAYVSSRCRIVAGDNGIGFRCFSSSPFPGQLHGKLLPGGQQLLPDFYCDIYVYPCWPDKPE